jgi:hypothetical protein
MTLALVHSPLTGPLVWNPVSEELARHRVGAIVADVADHPSGTGPFWEQEASSAARSLRGVGENLVLVAHSGAGALLPAIRERVSAEIAGYVFVDAVVPRDGASRIDVIRFDAPEWAAELQAYLETGARFPEWTDDDLRDVVPNDGIRRGLLEEIRPRPLAFFTEPIPVFEGWPDAPCGYLRLSEPYEPLAEWAGKQGWPVRALDAGHFHSVVDPQAVTDEILELLREMSVSP